MNRSAASIAAGRGADEPPVLRGNFAPVHAEHAQAIPLSDIEGRVPADLDGFHVRNGPNRRFASQGRYHMFDGDGMLHKVAFDHGRVTYSNRWVQTDGLSEELQANTALWRGIKDAPRRDRPDQPLKNTANTDVKFFAGELMATWYLGGAVYRCSPDTLATLGKLDADSRLHGLPVSAHAKVDERTGEMLFFAYGMKPPYMHYGVMDREHRLRTFMPVALPGPRLPHDMAVTPNWTILHDLPLFHDADALAAGRHKLRFHADMPARFALVPRHGSEAGIRWFEADPCYLYHVVNAWEETEASGHDVVVMIGTPFRLPCDAAGNIIADQVPRLLAELDADHVLYEWRFDLRTGRTRERVLDDIINAEFPVINSAWQGLRTRYSWHVLMARQQQPEDPRFCGLVGRDHDAGTCQVWHEGAHKWWSEPSFAPRDRAQSLPAGHGNQGADAVGNTHDEQAAENDGYIVSFMSDELLDTSFVTVFDARHIGSGPIARIRLPVRVPNGFHGTWVSAARLARGY